MQNTDVYAMLRQSLAGDRPVDERTQRSITMLAERLESLKRQHSVFSMVGFSPDMEQLAQQSTAAVVS